MKISFWPGMIFGLIGVNLLIVVVTVVAAHHGSGWTPTPGYDAKALRFQQELERRAASARLGWSASPLVTRAADGSHRIAIELQDENGEPIQAAAVRTISFHHGHAGEQITRESTDAPNGAYPAVDRAIHRGLWRIEVQATAGGQTFQQSIDVQVGGETP